MRDHHRALIAEAERLGGLVFRIEHCGRHPVLVGRRSDGSPIRLMISGTPSCHRSILNERARLRRAFAMTMQEV